MRLPLRAGVLGFLVALCGSIAAAQGLGPSTHRPPRVVSGEVIVRLRSDVLPCTNCLTAQARGGGAAGADILTQTRTRYSLRAMEPVFGGEWVANRRRATQQRFAARAGGAPAPDLSQFYLVRADPEVDAFELAAELRRDPDVQSAEPNYIYHTAEKIGAQATRAARLRLKEVLQRTAANVSPP